MNPLVSIIVPVFQVEKYLEKCISSIIAQTYKNLEIILVDDGSTDNCPAICEQFQREDDRIKVIHQENGGLSHARNVGLEVARGDYIGFVDSDDWIEPNMYENLMSALQESGADIAVCRYQIEFEDSTKNTRNIEFSKRRRRYSPEEALRNIFIGDGYISNAVWNKLYRKFVLANTKFTVGKICEDILWTALVVGNANFVIGLNYPLYHYLYRNEGLSKNSQQIVKRLQDRIEMSEQRIEFIRQYYPKLEKFAIVKNQDLCYEGAVILSLKYSNLDPDGKIRRELHRHFQQWGGVSIRDNDSLKTKIDLIFFSNCPELYLRIYTFIYHVKKVVKDHFIKRIC